MPNRPARCAWILLLWLLTPAFASAGPAKMKPRFIDEESFGETYTAVADLSDGTYILLQYVFTNAGFGDEKAACRALVIPPGRKGQNAAERFDSDEWHHKAGGNRLVVGRCHLSSQAGRTEFRVKAEKLAVTLVMNADAKHVRPPGHRVKGEDGFFEGDIMVPWATAKADVHAAGYVKKGLTGGAHLDHTRSTAMPPEVASRWYRFRALKGESPMLIQLRTPPKSRRAQGWIWSAATGKPTAVKASQVTLGKSKAKPGFTLEQDGVTYTVVTTKRLFRYNPADQYGFVGSVASNFIGESVTSTYRAQLTGPDGKVIEGTMEHTVIKP